MPVNIEIKAHLKDPKSALLIAEKLDVQSKDVRRQKDTYFDCRRGRLKLRETSGIDSELIFYDRDETDDIRRSYYEVYKIPPHNNLESILKMAVAVKNVVNKERHHFFYHDSRIYIDEVQKLGWFIEFEVPVFPDKAHADRMMEKLFEIFNIQKKDIVKESYLDLLTNKEKDERKFPNSQN